MLIHSQRPRLTDQQSERFSQANVLRWSGQLDALHDDPWAPKMPPQSKPDITVDAGAKRASTVRFSTLQAAISQLLSNGSPENSHIHIAAGYYAGPVYIPKSLKGLRITGDGRDATFIAAGIDARMSGRSYEDRFAKHFESCAPQLRLIFERIVAREEITPANSAVLRVDADGVTLADLSVENLYACDRKSAAPVGSEPNSDSIFHSGQHQAVAVHIAGADKIQMYNLRLTSFENTLYLQHRAAFSTARSYLFNCEIEGDVDFIFGQTTAYFEGCEIRSRGLRGATSWAVSPSTNCRTPFGFVFENCDFTHDDAEAGQVGKSYLGRQIFEGVRATPYGVADIAGYYCELSDVSRYDAPDGQISRATLESVGKCIILKSIIGAHINPVAPWADWSGVQNDSEGNFTPVEWNRHYRPAQYSATDFLLCLEGWTVVQDYDTRDIDANEVWLAEG